ncbi:MBL fold metallo-hydrolase [Desulfurobacterium atlanticum]|uniref:Beta-lactamase superfamily domain-containing protein n=1 Tax=Desulfurobacterium atlanticum TaxID=240169 RepID=A0A238YMR7_9BACT|nr:MBL fold metallo-hydrolase [Desulfurobacterium atlanticum]SNR72282.1 Beta-lactamase superfamily domain-containing protein [Desulfurobacterium atlanticum]
MEVYVAGAFGSRRPGMNLSTFVIDDIVVIDCGALFSGDVKLDKVKAVFLTHCHADHIKDLPFFIDVFPFEDFRKEPLTVFGNDEVIDVLNRHLFNGKVWPEIDKLKLENDAPAVVLREVKLFCPFKFEDYTVIPTPANHTVKTNGYAIFRNGKGVMISGDTYRCDEMWRFLLAEKEIKAFFVDVSYPSERRELSSIALHYNSDELIKDIERFSAKEKLNIYAYHLKYPFADEIKVELEKSGIFSLYDGQRIKV